MALGMESPVVHVVLGLVLPTSSAATIIIITH